MEGSEALLAGLGCVVGSRRLAEDNPEPFATPNDQAPLRA
jgi:hypothetical protein